MGPGALNTILEGLPNVISNQLIVGFDTSDDACVYKVSEDTAVIQTVDFFTPVADDPYIFGQVAAANALSDVYAMGGVPALAMNLLCVPNCLPPWVIKEILRGGHEKAVEAGCVIAGGHTIEDNEPKYGMCVTGFIHPDKVLRNVGAKPGDVLILTKPLGSGIIITAQKADLVSTEDYDAAIKHMTHLNKTASAAVLEAKNVHACTDVTGFGLLGHAYEMASGSNVTIVLEAGAIPLMSGAKDMAEMGMIPGGAYRNRSYVENYVDISPDAELAVVDIMSDPQTSGGLLVSLPEEDALMLLEKLQKTDPYSCIVGKVIQKGEKSLLVR